LRCEFETRKLYQKNEVPSTKPKKATLDKFVILISKN